MYNIIYRVIYIKKLISTNQTKKLIGSKKLYDFVKI